MRKRLLDYDDVMNIQREAIYKKRDHALEGERLTVDLEYMFNSTLQNLALQAKGYNDYEMFINDSISILGFEPEIDAAFFRESQEKELVAYINSLKWGELTVKIEDGEIIHIRRTESIKLTNR